MDFNVEKKENFPIKLQKMLQYYLELKGHLQGRISPFLSLKEIIILVLNSLTI